MIDTINPHHLEALRTLILTVAGIKNISPMHCRLISFSIMEKTKLSVSETTIKRFFGFAASKFSPSVFTLNALAIYVGYSGWEEFKKAQPVPEAVANGLLNDPLLALLMETSAPTVILKPNAPDFTILIYNKTYEQATNTKKRNLIGLTLWEAFDPENAGSYGPTLLLEAFHEVIYNQKTIHMQPLNYNIPSLVPTVGELSWWDIKITPVIYDGVVKYLLLNTYNITHKVLHQDAIEQAIMKELTLAEDLAVTNVKLSRAVEHLTESHEDLVIAKKQLEEANHNLEQRVFERTKKLFESEAKQRELIDHAPVAIAVIKGPKHVVVTANKKIIEYWGKGNTVLNKPLAVALPELEGQPFIGILSEVRNSGVAYINTELCAYLYFNGVYQPRYYDMVYQPIQLVPGVTDSIFIVAVDITEHVIARKKLEQSESMLRLAVTAARIGTWSFDPNDKILQYNPMLAEILGWDGPGVMTYHQALGQVTDEYKEKIVSNIENAIADGGHYNFVYAHERFNDGKVIWLSAIGKVTVNESGSGVVFSGVIREIDNIDADFRQNKLQL